MLFQGSIGRTDFPKGNHQDLIDSITQRLWPLGEDVMFIPGHTPIARTCLIYIRTVIAWDMLGSTYLRCGNIHGPIIYARS